MSENNSEAIDINIEEREDSPLRDEIQNTSTYNHRIYRKVEEALSLIRRQNKPKSKVSTHRFKYKGNENQHNFNSVILEDLERIAENLEDGIVSGTKRDVAEAISKIKERNKMLVLAETSPGGWDTVKEYMGGNLADDSEDEKRMRAAESRALAKRKRERPTASTRTASSREDIFRFAEYPPIPPEKKRSFNRQQLQPQPQLRQSDVCYQCGKTGHWKRNCWSRQEKKETRS